MAWLRRDPGVRAIRGRQAEDLACAFLAAQGYVIEQRNVRVPTGELDIVARDGQTRCFIEVRSTSSSAWGGPLMAVTPEKQRRVVRAARWYLRRFGSSSPEIRFDVVAIAWREPAPDIQLIRGAFMAEPSSAWD